eukprot:6735-Heterococcus_DN1.PRE.1
MSIAAIASTGQQQAASCRGKQLLQLIAYDRSQGCSAVMNSLDSCDTMRCFVHKLWYERQTQLASVTAPIMITWLPSSVTSVGVDSVALYETLAPDSSSLLVSLSAKRMTRSLTVRFCRAVPALCRGNIAVEQQHSAVEHASHITLQLQQCIAVVDSVLRATLLLHAKPAYDS